MSRETIAKPLKNVTFVTKPPPKTDLRHKTEGPAGQSNALFPNITTMEHRKPKKISRLVSRGLLLLALPVVLGAMVTTAKVKTPSELPSADSPAQQSESARLHFSIYDSPVAQDVAASSSDNDGWTTANSEIHARIALAFATEAMADADLSRVECRGSLCRVIYEAKPELQVRQVLPRQLAQTFNTVVTVHSGRNTGLESLVYIDIPARG